MLNNAAEVIEYDPNNRIIEGRDYFRHAPHTFNYTPYTYPHPLTREDLPENFEFKTEVEERINVSERLTDNNNNPLMANIIFSKEGIAYHILSTDEEGKYNLSITPSTYNIFFNITDLFIPDFWVNLLSVKISSPNYNKLISVAQNEERESIFLFFNISENQTIKTYSPKKPIRVLRNGTLLQRYDSLEDLMANYGWFYDGSKNILYIKFKEM